MRVSLGAAEAQDVDALSGHRPLEGERDAAHQSLKVQVLAFAEVGGHRLSMVDRRHEHVPAQDVEVRQEDDVPLVAMHDMRVTVMRTRDVRQMKHGELRNRST